MQGLFDFLKTPEGQGLLSGVASYAANARRGAPINSIGTGLLGGVMGYGGALDRQSEQAQLAKRNELYDAQMGAYKAKAAADAEALALERAKRAALPGLFKPPTMTGGEADPQMLGDVPMFSQPMGVTPMRQSPGGFDVMAAVRAGFKPDEIKAFAELPNAGRAKVARTVKGLGPDGREFEYQVDEFGQRVGEGMAQYRAPLQVSQGDRTTFADPYSLKPVGSFQTFQSPDSKASTETTRRGQDLTNRLGWANNAVSRAQLEQGKTELVNDPNQGPILVNKTTGVAAPVRDRAGAPLQSSAAAKQLAGSKKALDIINEAETLIDSATGSYLGAGTDVAAAVFGKSTPGAQATAKLKAMEGALMMAQPRMEGPQSNLDVALYRQMAAQIGDPTVPTETKRAALDTVRNLQEKYAGMEPGQSRPKQPARMPNAPSAVPTLRWNPQTRKLEQVR